MTLASAGTSPTAPSSPSTGAGATSTLTTTVATCCPDVTTFADFGELFGWDERTNEAPSDAEKYWVPPTKSRSKPGSRTTRDGSNWISIGVDKKDRVKLTFQGGAGPGCIRNTKFESDDPGIVKVLNSSVAASDDTVVLQGVARGEVTIVAECNGKVLGWLHVACYPVKKIKVAVRRIHSKHSESDVRTEGIAAEEEALLAGATAASAAAARVAAMRKARARGRGGYKSTNVPTAKLRAYFRKTYKAAVVDLRFFRLPARSVAFDTNAPTGLNILPAGAASVDYSEMDAIIAAAGDAKYDYNLFLVDNAIYSRGRLFGIARNIPSKWAFVFVNITGRDELITPERTAAHEIGHCMGMRHPHSDTACTAPAHLKGESGGTARDRRNLMTSSTNQLSNLADNTLRLYQWEIIQ